VKHDKSRNSDVRVRANSYHAALPYYRETGYAEIRVETEYLGYTQLVHQLKRHAIHHRKPLILKAGPPPDRPAFSFAIYRKPFDESGIVHQVHLSKGNPMTESIRQERSEFSSNEIAGYQADLLPQARTPYRIRRLMIFVGFNKQSIEKRSINPEEPLKWLIVHHLRGP
jgi:hypothetical protein